MAFLDRQGNEWDEVQASQWAKVATMLVAHHLPRGFFIDNGHQHLRKVVSHLESPSMVNLMSFVVGVEADSERASLLPYYVVDSEMVQIIVEEMLKRPYEDEFQINACNLLCNIVSTFSSLPSFSARFRMMMKPAAESMVEVLCNGKPAATMTHNMLRVLGELLQYDMRAAKYAALCGRESGDEEMPPFFGLMTGIMPSIVAMLSSKGLVLVQCLNLVKVLLTSEYDAMLQCLEVNDVMSVMVNAFFSYTASEFARHSILATIQMILRGSSYRAKMLLLESSNFLSSLPNSYRHAEKTKRQASLGHMASAFAEVLVAAATDSDVGCVVDAHGEWGQVRARYPRPSSDDAELGYQVTEILALFGNDPNEMADSSPARVPLRCLVSPVPERDSGSVSPASPEMKGPLTPPSCSPSPPSPRSPLEEDQDVLDVTGQLWNVAVVDDHEQIHQHASTDAIHSRTPIAKKPAKRPMQLLQSPIAMDEEEKENCEKLSKTERGNTPKKMIQAGAGEGYIAVSSQADTPKPKVQARSRTYLPRMAKSKSPFGSSEKKGSKSRLATPGSGEKMPCKRLF